MIDFNKYVNPLPYAKRHVDPKAYAAYVEESHKIAERLKADILAEAGLTGHPKAEKVWQKAWDLGHAAGYPEVLIYVQDLAELVL